MGSVSRARLMSLTARDVVEARTDARQVNCGVQVTRERRLARRDELVVQQREDGGRDGRRGARALDEEEVAVDDLAYVSNRGDIGDA